MANPLGDLKLGRVAVSTAIACLILLTGTAGVLAMPAIRSVLGMSPATPAAYAPGTRLDVAAELLAAVPRTAVIFARSDCGACLRAKPLLHNLVAAVQGRAGARVLLVTTTAHEAETAAFASDLGLDEAHVVRTDLGRLRLRVVPSVVLVDGQGVVLESREGLPSPDTWNMFSRSVLQRINEP